MIIETDKGKIEGIINQGYEQYLGIPYAAPPVGSLRFKPPVEHEPWDGVLECKKYGSAGPQLYVEGLTHFRGEGETPLNESCLYLNVTTPKSDDQKRPVLFWIHGGAFQKGSATMGFDELSFARENMVVVNCNYRIGVLGFMDLSEYLGEEYIQTGNTGMLDILMALTWVKKNIAAFGGDPENVTIMGQSAGAKIVGFLTCMKKAKGLFTKAMLLSGGVQCLRDQRTARCVADMFMKDAGLTKENAKELLTMPWEQIVESQKNLFAGLNLHTVGAVFDGVTFEGRNALDIILNHSGNNVPLFICNNRDEMDLYWMIYSFHELDDHMAERLFGDYAQVVKEDVDAYTAPYDKDSEEYHKAFVHIITEYIYRAGANQMAAAAADAGQPVYLCQNAYDKNTMKFKGEMQKRLACHGSESQFFFNSGIVWGDKESEEWKTQAYQMHESAVSFIRTGKPSADGMVDWPKFNTNERLQMVFDGAGRVERSPLPEVSPKMPHQVFWLH